VWRVYGSESFDPDDFARRYRLAGDTWRKGDQIGFGRKKRSAECSGFVMTVGRDDSNESQAKLMAAAATFVRQHDAAFDELAEQRAESHIDFLMGVGSSQSFVRCLSFPPEFLALLVSKTTHLDVMAAPVSDEE